MNELAISQSNLPSKIEDVAKFLLIAPEKATALRAEIRAIGNLHLAQEVYDQKMEEQRRLQELILDASVKLGEYTKALPKAPPGKKAEISDTAVPYFKPKEAAIKELGFSKKQVQRFETLADNKDLVEQVKEESRENGTTPTRTKVLELAQFRKTAAEKNLKRDLEEIETDYAALHKFNKIVEFANLYLIDEEVLSAVARVAPDFPETVRKLDRIIEMLSIIKNKLIIERGKLNG